MRQPNNNLTITKVEPYAEQGQSVQSELRREAARITDFAKQEQQKVDDFADKNTRPKIGRVIPIFEIPGATLE